MDQLIRYTMRFDGLTAADAEREAAGLRRWLIEIDPTIQVTRLRTDSEAMDFGAALAVVLAAPAIVELAKGVSSWLAKSHSSRITVIGSDGTIVVENIGSREAVGLAEKLQPKHVNKAPC